MDDIPVSLMAALTLLGHEFRDPGLAELALTHRSMGRPNNERMEFLGDALVNMLVAELLFVEHPRANEGDLSRMRAQLVSGAALATFAREAELGAKLTLGPGELKSGGARRDSILADAFEAVMAAIYFDAGFDACRASARAVFTAQVRALTRPQKDPKTRLQEWLQAKGHSLPEYTLTASRGEDHAKAFDVVCTIDVTTGRQFAGSGSSVRAAEQAAAEAAMDALESEPAR